MTQDVLDAPVDLGITEEDIQQYEQDGVVCLRGLFGPEWIDRLRDATERMLQQSQMSYGFKSDKGKFAGDIFVWQKDPDFNALVFESPMSLIAGKLMRNETVRFFADQLFVKEPGTQSKTPWHHDQTYWPVVGEGVCSIWLTMDHVTTETSGLEYIAGSHRWGRRFNPEDFGDSMSLEMFRSPENEKIPDIDADRDSYRILSWDMAPGDCLVHHSLAVHGAQGNKSTTMRRRAISTRWFGESARFRPFAMYNEEATGLKPGDPMDSPMFPIVEVPAAYRR